MFKGYHVALVGLLAVTGCAKAPEVSEGLNYEKSSISLEMFDQPAMKPQEGWYGRQLTYPTDTVPVSGKEAPTTEEEADALANPIPADEASLAAGKFSFSKNCAACHSMDGKGQNPVAEKLMANGMPIWDITLTAPGRSDGYIYRLIRHGGMNMPAYGPQTNPDERWHIVNYLRSLTPQ